MTLDLMLKRGSLRLGSQLAKSGSRLTGQGKKMKMRRNKGAFSCRAEATCRSFSLPVSVCLSVSPIPDVYAHSPPRRAVCVRLVLFSRSLPHISLLSVLRSAAAVLVMAVCPWCKLAVGSQVARMTVIDVQVFNSSHTETLEQHTNRHTYTPKPNTHACTPQLFTCIHRKHASSDVPTHLGS